MNKPNILSIEQLLHLKTMLDGRYEYLQSQSELQEEKQIRAANDGSDNEQEDFSALDNDTNVEQELNERHGNELLAITHAKQRLVNGTFGICIDCQTPIDFPRLLAYSTALRCMSCQERYELLKKLPSKGVKHLE